MMHLLAMVKRFGIPTYFLILSCAGQRWEELRYVVNKLNKLGLSDEEFKSSGTVYYVKY